MMELKVWVDGIQRVVCGVTTETTCQDVVIALAHAMSRTGRFTLVEKWRDIEQPLMPEEQPLRVLHKWGEYACEVKLILCQHDTDKLKQRDRHEQPDRFSHNFSPPKTQAESSIKRNLTFSGAHLTHSLKISNHSSNLKREGILENGVHGQRSSSNSSTSSTRSSPHPVPAPRQRSPGNLPRPAPRHSPLLNGQISSLPNKPNVVRSQPFHTNNNQSLAVTSPANQHPSTISSHRGRSPSPHFHKHNSPSPVLYPGDSPHQKTSPSPSQSSPSADLAPVTAEEHSLDGPLDSRRASSEIEEYDLDMNFPDILRDSKRPERPSVHMEYHLEESTDTKPEPERARLLRLVSLQTERLKVQESQLDVIETEIVSLEEKELEYEQDLKQITDDLVQLEQRDHDDELEMSDLSSVQWVEVLGQEQNTEKSLKSEISGLKVRLNEMERKLTSQKERAVELENEIETARKEKAQKEAEAERLQKEKETQCLKDSEEVTKDLQVLEKTQLEKSQELKKVEEEVEELVKHLKSKEQEFADLEKDLKKANLEEFGTQSLSPTHGKPADTGEAVLKILEGRLSPRPQIAPASSTQQAFINSLASKNPNGVWV